MSNLNINIIFTNNKSGLTHDAKILAKSLDVLYSKNKNINIKIRPCNFYSFETGYADINIYLEIPNPLLNHYAKINILIPNQEWFYKSWTPYLDDFDFIWCKSNLAYDIFKNLVDSEKVINLGWTSIDRFIPKYSEDKVNFLHIAGKSPYKGTNRLIENWDEKFPILTIIYSNPNIKTIDKNNINYINDHIPDDELIKIMNENKVHLCLSEAEGFGHYIMEALSTKSVVITTNSKPMNTFVSENFCVDINEKLDNIKGIIGKKCYFKSNSFQNKIQEILKMDKKTLIKIGSENRERYLDFNKNFRKKLDSNIKLLCTKIKKLEYNVKIPREISKKVDDLPKISVVTLTYNRPEFHALMVLNYKGIDYPRDKIEWVIVDDSDIDKKFNLENSDKWIKYVRLEEKTTIGEKRNIGVENSSYDYICFMDDDDIYYPKSLLIRYTYLDFYKKNCCYCTTIGCFHIKKLISHINVPPIQYNPEDRVSEASLFFKKSFWKNRKFDSQDSYCEGKNFIKNRYNECLEVSYKDIFFSLLHENNTSNKITLGDKPNGCHFGISDELFNYITTIQTEI